MIGALPNDFLSLDGGQSQTSPQHQNACTTDEELARALQYGQGGYPVQQVQSGVPGQLPPCVGRLSITVAQVSNMDQDPTHPTIMLH